MLYTTYVIQSTHTDRLYIGQTNNLKDRLFSTNSKTIKNNTSLYLSTFIDKPKIYNPPIFPSPSLNLLAFTKSEKLINRPISR